MSATAPTIASQERGTPPEVDFGDELATMLDHAAVAMMLSIGHRTGLLDRLATRPAFTSAALADAAGLHERYVREWLAVMVTGGIVRYDPDQATYHLPARHAAHLTRDGAEGNLAVYAQAVALMGAMQERVLECFASGDGIAYDEYPCFHQFMAEDSGQTVVAGIDGILGELIPDIVARLETGIDVLDAGCGSGLALVALARRYPRSRFTGHDLCADAIENARRASAGLDNVRFEVRDLRRLGPGEAFDLVTSFDAVHDTADPAGLLSRIRGVLRPGGVHLMQDIAGSARLENNLDFPFAPLLYAISCTHCTPVSRAQGGEGLGTMWGHETAEAMLRAAGFDSVARHHLAHDPMNVWFVSRAC